MKCKLPTDKLRDIHNISVKNNVRAMGISVKVPCPCPGFLGDDNLHSNRARRSATPP